MTNRAKTIIQRVCLLTLVAALASPLSACGRKGSPERPPGGDYPKQYPGETKVKPSDEEPANGSGINPYTYPNQ